jgi:hypothetical protein
MKQSNDIAEDVSVGNSGAENSPDELKKETTQVKKMGYTVGAGTAVRDPSEPTQTVGIGISRKRLGEAAEAAFLQKAISMGFSVAKPWGESDRYDFILENGANAWRVQVKSSSYKGKSGYAFRAAGNVHYKGYTAKEIDFLVFYIVPEDSWYVFPISLFSKHHCGTIGARSEGRKSRYEKYREAWCLMACPKGGECRKQIDLNRVCQNGEAKCPKE